VFESRLYSLEGIAVCDASVTSARDSEHRGITFAAPTVDLTKLRTWKESIITKLAGGITQLAKMRNVEVVKGRAYFEGSQTLRIETDKGSSS